MLVRFPYTIHETVPTWLLVVANTAIPIVIIAITAILFIPGATVPKGTPKSLVWRRKLWELHTGLLGLALSLISAWFITNGMKNLFGKPRPDLLARCQPDLANLSRYIVGGIANSSSNGQLVSAAICMNTDKDVLDDGFRSYPSGHASSSAAGLIYLSLFIASKFAITIPFLAPSSYSDDHSAGSAFPSRLLNGKDEENSFSVPLKGGDTYELSDHPQGQPSQRTAPESLAFPADPTLQKRLAAHAQAVRAIRRQAAAPPLYLLLLSVIPFFAAVFIASSRWFDFRHHGFDILFGFTIGTITAFFAFRYYHLPIGRGAGWAWGPRSRSKAFWAGVGSYSFATDRELKAGFYGGRLRHRDEEEAIGNGHGASRGVMGTGTGSARESLPDRGAPVAVGRKTSREEMHHGVRD